jgi:hypothetical protein
VLERDAAALVIRGRMKPSQAHRADDCPRRCHDRPDDPAPFEAAPRRWAALDFDSVPCPGGVDPTDPLLAGGAVRLLLPDWARRASYVAQLTSGAGRKSGLRVRLWAWCDRAVPDEEWKRLLRDAPVDLALFSAVQPHFTAAPIFADPALEPCVDGRLAVLPGEPELAVPPASVPPRASSTTYTFKAARRPAVGLGFAPTRRSPFKSTRTENYMRACVRAIAEARGGDGHPTAVRVSYKLFQMVRLGLLDPSDVAGRVKGAFLSRRHRDTTEAEVDSVLRWAWDRNLESDHG